MVFLSFGSARPSMRQTAPVLGVADFNAAHRRILDKVPFVHLVSHRRSMPPIVAISGP